MTLNGNLIIGGRQVSRAERFYAFAPATGMAVADQGFSVATAADVADACAAAEAAFLPYSGLPLEQRAAFLDTIADELELSADATIERSRQETGLAQSRLTGEHARTTNQLRIFAGEVRDRRWQRLRVDRADPARVPPRPDLRMRMVPVGPVAVFGASNFPLAFSVAGGDTASALAAGCPVVVKGHPAHPGTSELVATAIARAAAAVDMPGGVFSLLSGPAHNLGAALVADARIRAVGFTGSRKGGLALMKIAAERPVPIPVYAEMSSINPVIFMPHALAMRSAVLAREYVASATMGAGQFCTNPGLLLGIDGPAFDAFLKDAGALLAGVAAQTMLTEDITRGYEQGRAELADSADVRLIAEGLAATGPTQGQATLFSLTGKAFLGQPTYAHEVFGATSLAVRCSDLQELAEVIAQLEGQLTATLQVEQADYAEARRLLPMIERKVGRVVVNGWPTGVGVGHAMVHGGPFPATSDGRSTSVGTLAIERFLRPVSYQNMPDALLPHALRDEMLDSTLARIDPGPKP